MEYDVLVIGSGSAGASAAQAAVEAGAKRVAIVEKRKRLGGECPNRGCVPTKALLRSVEVLRLARRAKEFGLRIPKADGRFSELMRRKAAIVDRSTGKGRIEKILKSSGIELLRGAAAFAGRNELRVGAETHRAKKIVIAAGSETFVPPVEGLKEAGYLTSDDTVELKKLPGSIVIVGGGPIGAEWAQIFAPLGTKVTVVEFMPQLLPREEPEIAAVVEASFKRQRIAVMTSTKVVRVAKRGRGIIATVEPAKGGAPKRLSAGAIMVATGKLAALGGLSVERAGVALDEKGRPKLNDYLQTTNPDVYVAGDAAGQMMFTNVAHYQGEIAAQNAVKGNSRRSDLSVVPRGTFCSPEVGSVGATEAEAKQRGHEVAIGRFLYAGLGKASVMDEREGLVKIVADRKTKKVLGGHAVGHSAAEIVHELALAMRAGIPHDVVADMIHAFPTFAEGVGAAAYGIS